MNPKIIFIDWYKTLSTSKFCDGMENEYPNEYKLIVNSFLNSNGSLINPWMRGDYTTEKV